MLVPPREPRAHGQGLPTKRGSTVRQDAGSLGVNLREAKLATLISLFQFSSVQSLSRV